MGFEKSLVSPSFARPAFAFPFAFAFAPPSFRSRYVGYSALCSDDGLPDGAYGQRAYRLPGLFFHLRLAYISYVSRLCRCKGFSDP